MPFFRRLMGSLKVELNPKHEVLDLRNKSRSPNCGHILSSSPICGHCLDGCMRALCLEKEWSSLTHADGQEKWGKETGAIWKVLKETGLVAGGPSRGGGHTVPPEITAVFGRVKTTHEVPGTRAQPISGRSWPLMVPLVTVREQVMEREEPGPRPWTGRWMWVGRRWRQSSGAEHPRATWGPRPVRAWTPNLLVATPEATAVHLFWSEPAEAQVVLSPGPEPELKWIKRVGQGG